MRLPGLARAAGLALALAAFGVGGVAAGGCGEDEPPPVTVAKEYAAAVKSGNVEKVLTLVESSAAERLERAASRASDQVGGRRAIEPHEMLQIVDVDPRFQVAKAELVDGDESRATVRLTGADDRTHELALVNEDGEWHVVLPLPSGPDSDP